MLSDRCPIEEDKFLTDYTASIAAAVLPFAIQLLPVGVEYSVKALTAYLQKQKDNLNGEFVATGAGAFWSGEKQLAPKCLIIVRGKFGKTFQPADDERKFSPLTSEAMAALGLVEFPDFYLQIKMTAAGEEGSITLTPNLFAYRDTSAINIGSGKKSISVLLAIAEAPFVSKSGGKASKEEVVAGAAARAAFALADRQVGSVYDGRGAADKNLFAGQTRSITLRRSDKTLPPGALNLVAVVTESENPGMMYDILLDTLGGNEKTIEKALSDFLTDAIKKATEKKS